MSERSSITNILIIIGIFCTMSGLYLFKSIIQPEINYRYQYLDASKVLKNATLENMPKEIIDEIKENSTPLVGRIISSGKILKYKDAFILYDRTHSPFVFIYGIIDYDVVKLIYDMFYQFYKNQDSEYLTHIRIYCDKRYNKLFESFGWIQDNRLHFIADKTYENISKDVKQITNYELLTECQWLTATIYEIYTNQNNETIGIDDFLKSVKVYGLIKKGKPVSMIYLVEGAKRINKILNHKAPEIYIATAVDHMELGYGKEISQWVINHHPGVKWICDATNKESIATAKSLGLKKIGELNSLIFNSEEAVSI